MIPGLSSRLQNEIKELYVARKFKGDRSGLNRVKVEVHDPPRRKNAVFLGASFMSSFAEDHQYITKAEWEEQGSKIFHAGK
jgi:actin-related protein 2